MLTWAILISTIALSQCWVLEVNEKHVAKKLTNNVTFFCHYDGSDNGEAALMHVSRIRLLKFETSNKWKTVAKLSDIHPEVVTKFSSSQPEASGHAGDRTTSFMSIRFDIATSDVIGQYMCEVDGYDVADELLAVKTDPVIVSERGVSFDDLLTIILTLKTEEEGAHTTSDLRLALLEKSVRVAEGEGNSRGSAISKLADKVNSLSADFLRVSDDLIKKQRQILADLEIIKDVTDFQRQAWPEGVYTMLNTTSGCPASNSFNWVKSNLRVATQQGATNADATSGSIHLAGPVLEKSNNYHYINLRFCTKKVGSAGPAWPKGSYCIDNYSGTCPTNLFPGSIQIDRENIGSYDTATELLSAVRNNDLTTIKYCCRKDGDAENPILLPAGNPFYLYRYGGKCQEVIGMDVSEEWIYMDTKETKDAFITDFHPDATLKNIKLQLCYYTPKA